MPRKMAQSAMEFLMTYGWALLIMVIIIAVLFYLGILQPKTPNSLIFSPGFSASSFRIGNGTGAFELDFGHAKGQTIRVTKAGCSMQEIPTLTQSLTNLTNPVVIPSGTHKWIIGGDSGNTLNCLDENGNPLNPSNAEVGQRYRGKVCIEYEEVESGLTRQVCGDLNARFESGVSGATPTPTPTPTPPPCASGGVVQSCPCTLDVPGSYTIKDGGLSSSVTCITITSGGSGSTLDCGGKTISGIDYVDGHGIYLSSATGVTVKNCVVENFYNGIFLNSSSGNTIMNNNVTIADYGIHLISSNDSIITHNKGYSTSEGITLEGSNRNNIVENNVSLNTNNGITLVSSSNNNNITRNDASSNNYGIILADSTGNVLDSNIVCGNNIFDLHCVSSSQSGNSTYNSNDGCTGITKIGSCS